MIQNLPGPTIERAVVLSQEAEISLDKFVAFSSEVAATADSMDEFGQNIFCIHFTDQLPCLDEVIDRYIEFAVTKKGGAKDKTAKEIGIDRKTLYKHLIRCQMPKRIQDLSS